MTTATRTENFEQYTTLFGHLVSRIPGMLDRFNILMLEASPSMSKLDIELAKIQLLESELGPREEIPQLQKMAAALFNTSTQSV